MATPFPCAGMTSFRVTRANHCDDVLTAVGAYAHVARDGSLRVRSEDGTPLGRYLAGDWTSVSPLTTLSVEFVAPTEDRPCTCHPSEAPVPCAKRYALSECLAAPTQPPTGSALEGEG